MSMLHSNFQNLMHALDVPIPNLNTILMKERVDVEYSAPLASFLCHVQELGKVCMRLNN